MTKDVLLSISGLQNGIDPDDMIEVINCGTYYKKNDKHYVLYEEVLEEEGNLVTSMASCILKISDDQIEIKKKGSVNTQMIFEESTTHTTFYNTNMGDLIISISTDSIEIQEKDTEISVCLKYNLDLNYQHISQCELLIKIESK